MDLLAKELARKKQALQKAKEEQQQQQQQQSDKKKYLKLADLRRLEEEEQERQEEERRRKRKLQEQEEAIAEQKSTKKPSSGNKHHLPADETSTKKKRKKAKKTSTDEDDLTAVNKATGEKTGTRDRSESSVSTADTSNFSAQELSKQLRSFGLPIRLFGETLAERKKRLAQAIEDQNNKLLGLSEKEEFKLGQGHGIRNPFLEKEEEKAALPAMNGDDETGKPKSSEEKDNTEEVVDASDPPKYIYKYFKGLLKQWEQDLAERPESVRKTAAGKTESKTVKQCKDYIRPLFKLCKNRRLEDNMQAHLMKIVLNAEAGEFVKAHDAYMDVAIGRAAWPIGVTMVGIHARSGRAKIESSNVAHVMNSELQRKYLTSVKRLLSYAQKKRPDVDPSKKVF